MAYVYGGYETSMLRFDLVAGQVLGRQVAECVLATDVRVTSPFRWTEGGTAVKERR
jgi:hypothetical protein